MREFSLARVTQNDFATYGELHDDTGATISVTLELPWHNNQHNISCILAGRYVCRRRYSVEHGRVLFWIDDVPGRGCVELHIGCLPSDSKGCILLGTAFGFVEYPDGRKGDGVTGSHAAFDRFMNLLEGADEFALTITDVPGVMHTVAA